MKTLTYDEYLEGLLLCLLTGDLERGEGILGLLLICLCSGDISLRLYGERLDLRTGDLLRE
jgi:hypothetical protein